MRPLLFALLLPACLSAHERAIVGSWAESPRSQRHTFDKRGSSVELTSIVDYDGEAFEVVASEVSDTGVSWIYRVPSTDYIVTCTVDGGVRDQKLTYSWSSQSPDGQVRTGTTEMTRSPP